MSKILYLEPEILDKVKLLSPEKTDNALIEAVDSAIKSLPENLREVVRGRYFEGLSIPELAQRMESSESRIGKLHYEALRLLKIALADFAKKRWGIEIRGICKICVHPNRKDIDRILSEVDCTMSWSLIARKIESVTGERIHPPQVLKAHLKHIQGDGRIN